VSSFVSLSPQDTLFERSFYLADQNQKYRVVVESQLPRVADDLDDFGERAHGDVEDSPFLDVVACMKGSGCDSLINFWGARRTMLTIAVVR
jgi:hypothetical protein